MTYPKTVLLEQDAQEFLKLLLTYSKTVLFEQDAQEFLKLLLTYMEDKLTPNMALPEKLRLLIQVYIKP